MEKEIAASVPINKTYFGKSERKFQYLATLSVCSVAVSSGMVLAWSSPAISDLTPSNGTNATQPKFSLTKNEEALLGSVLNLGALLFAVPTGFIADRFGRKTAIYGSGAAFLFGWIAIVAATNVEMLLIGRFLGGMGLGGSCVVSPMYVAEIAENAIRATLTSYFQLFLSFGILFTFVLGSFVDYVTMSMVLAAFSVVLFVTFPFMPESHVHFAKIGKFEEAKASLLTFRGKHLGYDIDGEMAVINEEIRKSKKTSGKLSDVIASKANIKALFAVWGLFAFQHLCGINAVTFYTEQIFNAAGTNIDPSYGAIFMAIVQCIGGSSSMTLINRAGRKYFLFLSSFGMLIGLFGLGMFFHLRHLSVPTITFGFLPVACAALYILAFTLGYGIVPYMAMHELLSPELRGIGGGIAVVIAWICSFLITYTFPISLAFVGKHITFYILTLMNVIAIVFVVIFVPETRGRSLIEIQELLEK